MKQLDLFCDEGERAQALPDLDPGALLRDGWDLVVSISGGKDSQAMLRHLTRWHRQMAFKGQIIAVHADLGRAEWGVTPRVVAKQCADAGVPLHVVRRNDGLDLPALIDRRRHKLAGTDKPFWPSSAARYCTSDEKRAVINVWVNNHFPTGRILVTMGMRAEESKNRARLPILSERKGCHVKKRQVLNWLPIHDWTLSQVWWELGYRTDMLRLYQAAIQQKREGGMDKQQLVENLLGSFVAHPAYALGNERLSCALCVLAGENDLLNGAEFAPDLYRQYTRWEMESGWSFQDGKWLSDLRPDLLEPEVRKWQADRGA